VRAPGALEGAETAREVEGTVARDPGTLARHLLLSPGLVLDTAGLRGPGPVLLAHGDVVATEGTDHQAGVPWVGLGTVTSKPWAGHQGTSSSSSSIFLGGGNLLTPPASSISPPALLISPWLGKHIVENKGEAECQEDKP